MTTVYFVRHAQPNYLNHNDRERELTAKGLADCALVTQYLSDKSIDVVLSSPYKRAVDTVKDFADQFHLEIETVEAFRERKIGEAWIEDFDGFSKRQWVDFTYKRPEGEALCDVQKRNVEALFEVLERHRGKNIVIGSHGTALSTVIHYFNNAYSYEDFVKIKGLCPWVVKFVFEAPSKPVIEYVDVLGDVLND